MSRIQSPLDFIGIPRSSAATGTSHDNATNDDATSVVSTQPGDAPQLCCDWELHFCSFGYVGMFQNTPFSEKSLYFNDSFNTDR